MDSGKGLKGDKSVYSETGVETNTQKDQKLVFKTTYHLMQGDREAAYSSLTGVTALWSLSKTHLS